MKERSWIREPAVAGRFYPSDPKKLSAMLDSYLPSSPAISPAPPVIVAPHAGYLYSGAIAGEVYKRLKIPETVVLLCPNHTGMGKAISIWGKGAWKTPLGEVSIDESLAESFLKNTGEPDFDQGAHLEEHANEVHVPFLQRLNPQTKIVPVVLGPLRLERCLELGSALARAIESRGKDKVLVVASTDMSHYISAEAAKKKDGPALEAIEQLDSENLYARVVEDEISMCGFIPTTTALKTARDLGASQGKLLRYGNSGETTKDFRSVVAYAAAVCQ